jgi:thioesterase domain-containing protein/acyl carrier protein
MISAKNERSHESPRHRLLTPLQHQIAWIWQDVLGVAVRYADEDFFSLGGESLAAVRVTMEVNESLGLHIPLTAIFEEPTIGGLAEYISSQRTLAAPSLCIWPSREGASVVYVPSAWGHEFSARSFLNALGMRAVVLRARGLEPGETPRTSLAEITGSFLERVVATDPGPYVFCGYSMGGFVAYEMARLAIAQGAPTIGAVLLDTPVLTQFSGAIKRAMTHSLEEALTLLRLRIIREQPNVQGSGTQPAITDMGCLLETLTIREILERVVLSSIKGSLAPDVVDHYLRRIAVYQANTRALDQFVFVPSAARICWVTTTRANAAEWNLPPGGSLTVIPVGVSHADILADMSIPPMLRHAIQRWL